MKKAKLSIKYISLLLLLLLLCSNLSLCFADQSDRRVVRVACGMNEILYLNDDGTPDGLGVSYLRQLAWNQNWQVEYITGSYNESLQKLYNGEIDLMFPIGREEDPAGKLFYSAFNAGYQQIGLFARADADIYYEDFAGFNNTRVGFSVGPLGNIIDEYALQNGFTYEKVAVNSTQDKIEALNNGDVDLVAFSTLNTVPNGKLVAIIKQVPFYICTTAGNQAMLDEINRGMGEIMIHTPEIASGFYQAVLAGKNSISYTREEHEKIKNSRTLVFGVYGDRLPLAGIDAQGNCTGIYVDLLNELAEESGLTIEIKPIEDSNRLYSYIDDGTVDFVIGIKELRFSQDNAQNHLSSNNLTDSKIIAITRSGYALDKADSVNVALTKDRTYLEAVINGWFPKAHITYYDTRRECLDAVNEGSFDVTFLNAWEYNYESKNSRYDDLMEWQSYQLLTGPTLGASRQSDLEILSILEKSIGRISAARITDIITTNLNNPYKYTLSDRLYAARTMLLIGGVFVLLALISLYMYIGTKRRYIRSLEAANRTKSDFLSRMSHELRTPLNAINGYTTVIEENFQDARLDRRAIKAGLEFIHRAVNYQLSIIDDLLDIQKIESGRIELHKTEIDIGSHIDNIITMIKPEAEEKQLRFIYDGLPSTAANYLLDGVRLQQVLLNLLHNAVKFTDKGGTVKFSAEIVANNEERSVLKFTIADTGIGMSEEFQRDKLFKRFSQEHGGNTSPYDGCGTGLEISQEIMLLMDGEITCKSKQGVGTTFTVTLPAECVKKRRRRRKSEYQQLDLSGIRILLCEDNKMNQDMECRLLKRMKCEVDVADDGQIGFDKFKASPEGYYDVILMDLRMPNMDGWECTRQIRALERTDAKNVLIFAVSANAFEEDIRLSLEAGMNEHFAKPVNLNIVGEKILSCLKKASEN